MLLSNFLQLINDLNNQTPLYAQIGQELHPLSKVSLTRDACEFHCEQRPLTKKKLLGLLGKGSKAIPVIVCLGDQQLMIFGMQILTDRPGVVFK